MHVSMKHTFVAPPLNAFEPLAPSLAANAARGNMPSTKSRAIMLATRGAMIAIALNVKTGTKVMII